MFGAGLKDGSVWCAVQLNLRQAKEKAKAKGGWESDAA